MIMTEQPAPSGNTMLYVYGIGYLNAKSAATLGMKGEEAYSLPEPNAPEVKPRKRAAPKADNDNAVFDTAEATRELPPILDDISDWQPPRMRGPKGVPVFRFGLDGPSPDHFIRSGQAWYSSQHYRGQLNAERIDWPLVKLLKAEGNDHCLALAERYRGVFDAATNPVQLLGKDMADNVYLMHRTDLDESTGKLTGKGLKKVKGKKARLDEPATRCVKADPDKTKRRAKPMPRKWQGDWPLLHKIDCGKELAELRSALGWLKDAFEAAVCFGDKLEEIGRTHGVGNQAGAKGAGRALVMLGMQAVDEFWQKPARRAA